ncbi:MAG: RHS repeat-associated core domain-containing protein [Planctomycetes bacterium]|nr:RHS repeat-associated core domain-containing protein [Planctomycetota bacterium]
MPGIRITRPVISGAPESATFEYDAEDRLPAETRRTIRKLYAYDTLCDYTKVGPVETFTGIYVSPGIDGRLARIDGDGVATYTFGDALQSVHQVTNAAGAVLRQTFTDAWGNNIPLGPTPPPPTGPGDRFAFQGRENDTESGLMHFRARSYDPMTGRFTSRDPVPHWNLYHFADNDPVNKTDPFGRDAAADAEYRRRVNALAAYDPVNDQGGWDAARAAIIDWINSGKPDITAAEKKLWLGEVGGWENPIAARAGKPWVDPTPVVGVDPLIAQQAGVRRIFGALCSGPEGRSGAGWWPSTTLRELLEAGQNEIRRSEVYRGALSHQR